METGTVFCCFFFSPQVSPSLQGPYPKGGRVTLWTSADTARQMQPARSHSRGVVVVVVMGASEGLCLKHLPHSQGWGGGTKLPESAGRTAVPGRLQVTFHLRLRPPRPAGRPGSQAPFSGLRSG